MSEKSIRQPRHSDEAEISVLGAMLLDVEAVDRARELVEERHFYQRPHRILFAGVCRIRDRGATPDALALRDELKRTGEFDEAGGDEYLARIVDIVPTASNVEYHCRRVREEALVRALCDVGGWLVEESRNGSDAEELLGEAERRVFGLSERSAGDREVLVADALATSIRSLERREEDAIPTPWPAINRPLSGGLHAGELFVVAARPSVGKTSLASQITLHASVRQGVSVLLVSLEMSAECVIRRLICMASGLAPDRIRADVQRTSDEEEAFQAALRVLKRAEIRVATGLDTVGKIVSRARRFAANTDRPLVVVDYLQLVAGQGETRAEQVGTVSRGLKRLSMEIGAPIVVAAQLNREAEKRSGPPQLSDLRESGAVEADADVVMLLERPELALIESEITPDLRGLCRCWIRKNRNGATGLAELHFAAATGVFTERERHR